MTICTNCSQFFFGDSQEQVYFMNRHFCSARCKDEWIAKWQKTAKETNERTVSDGRHY